MRLDCCLRRLAYSSMNDFTWLLKVKGMVVSAARVWMRCM